MHVLGLEFLALALKVGVKLGQSLPEILQCAFEQFVGDEQFCLNIFLLYGA